MSTNDGCKLVACQLCRVMVASIADHEGGARHQAARRLAAAALDRLRAHFAPQINITDITANPKAKDLNTDVDQVFCGACVSNVPASDKNHWRCKAHLTEALDEQLLDELVREYVEDEDLPLMEASSKDPSDGLTGKIVGNCEVGEKYECYLCDVPIPTVFRAEHELSVRHRANLACANAASRRINAHLAPTVSTILPPETSTADKITPLLKIYVRLDTQDEPEIFEKGKEKVTETEANATAEIRLTSKKYFTEVQKHINAVGECCVIIADNTEYVTVKSGNILLRVHVADFNGVYNVGNEMICRLCDYKSLHKSYSSVMQHDKLHVMSLGHMTRVLTPIFNVHGIRKLENYYFCIICNVCLPSRSELKNHITMDIQHAALLPEALARGNAFKESKDDVKIFLYDQGTSSTRAVKPPNPYVNYPTLSGIYSQPGEMSHLFGQSCNNINDTFGYCAPQIIKNWPGQTCSKQPTENAPSPKGFGTTTTAFGNSQTGKLPNQNIPSFFAESSNNTNATFGSCAPQIIKWPNLNGPGQTCSEHPTENAPSPKGVGTTTTAIGTAQTGKLPNQNIPTLFAQSSNNTNATFGSCAPQIIKWPNLNGPGQTCSEHPTENAPSPKGVGTTTTAIGTAQTRKLPNQNIPTLFAESSNNTNATFGSCAPQIIKWPNLNGPGQTCSEHPTENAPSPKGVGTTTTAIGTAQTGKLPNQNIPTLFAESSNNTNATFGSCAPQIIKWPNLNGPGQTCSEHPTENAPSPKGVGTSTTAFGTSQTGKLPNQNIPSFFAQSSNNTNATFGSCAPQIIKWPNLNGPGQTCSEHPTENAPSPKGFGTTATAFGISQTGNLPNHIMDIIPTLLAQASDYSKTLLAESDIANPTFGYSTQQTKSQPIRVGFKPKSNGNCQKCSEQPTEKAQDINLPN